MSNLNAKEYKTFEGIKHITKEGVEFWFARELSSVLQYADWKNFAKVINRAMLACKNSGYEVLDHFAEVGKMVDIGSDTKREIKDYELTRYACYLIVQNSYLLQDGIGQYCKKIHHFCNGEFLTFANRPLFRVFALLRLINKFIFYQFF